MLGVMLGFKLCGCNQAIFSTADVGSSARSALHTICNKILQGCSCGEILATDATVTNR